MIDSNQYVHCKPYVTSKDIFLLIGDADEIEEGIPFFSALSAAT